MIHYHCRHCKIRLGTLPITYKDEILPRLKSLEEQYTEDPFLHYEENGTLTVYAICECCEKTLQQTPQYYTLEKWLQ